MNYEVETETFYFRIPRTVAVQKKIIYRCNYNLDTRYYLFVHELYM